MFDYNDCSNKLGCSIKQNASLGGRCGFMSINRLLRSGGEHTKTVGQKPFCEWSEWCWTNTSLSWKKRKIERSFSISENGLIEESWLPSRDWAAKGKTHNMRQKERAFIFTEIYFVMQFTNYSKTKTHRSWELEKEFKSMALKNAQ